MMRGAVLIPNIFSARIKMKKLKDRLPICLLCVIEHDSSQFDSDDNCAKHTTQ
jgi:hypothetical protein